MGDNKIINRVDLPIHMDDDAAARIEQVAPGIKERAISGDREGRFPYDDMAALKKAGLFALEVPREEGGLGHNTAQANHVFREIARLNSSTAQVFFVHSVGVRSIPHLASPSQTERYIKAVAEDGARFGVAASEHGKTVMDWNTKMTRVEGGYTLAGTKHFCTGHEGSDYIMVFGVLDTAPSLVEGVIICMVKTVQDGVVLHGDWDAMGQRQTSSGSVTFENVFVSDENIFGEPGSIMKLEPSLWGPYYQSAFSALHMGMAQGALDAAVDYARTKTRPWPSAGVEQASFDPYIQRTVGDLQAKVSAGHMMCDYANEAALHIERGLLDRGEGAVRIAETKVYTTECALDVTSAVFQVCGARATYRKNGIDRFYRSARTMTLHDPVDWKRQEIGNYLLNDTPPMPTFYS